MINKLINEAIGKSLLKEGATEVVYYKKSTPGAFDLFLKRERDRNRSRSEASEGYSGTIADIHYTRDMTNAFLFSFKQKPKAVTKKLIDTAIEWLLDNVSKREGGIIRLGNHNIYVGIAPE